VVVWSLGKSVSPEDMVSGIESITDGIILAAVKFADAKLLILRMSLMLHGVKE
jgi:hypothetical protein